MSLKDAYVEIETQRDAAQKAAQEHDSRSLELRRRATHLNGILVTLKDAVCQRCRGRGEYFVTYSQDDTKMEQCSMCNGTGLPV